MSDETTFFVRGAAHGDPEALEWIVRRFQGILMHYARRAAAKHAAGRVEPEDLVQETWKRGIPKLPTIREYATQGRRYTPILLQLLGTTLRNVAMETHRRGGRESTFDASMVANRPSDLPALERILDAERRDAVFAAIERLDPTDRQIIVMRLVEGSRNRDVCEELGIAPDTASHRFRAALERLKVELEGTLFDDFDLGDEVGGSGARVRSPTVGAD